MVQNPNDRHWIITVLLQASYMVEYFILLIGLICSNNLLNCLNISFQFADCYKILVLGTSLGILEEDFLLVIFEIQILNCFLPWDRVVLLDNLKDFWVYFSYVNEHLPILVDVDSLNELLGNLLQVFWGVFIE